MPLSEAVLVIMGLLTVAMVAAAICKNIPIPYTVFLVVLGIILGFVARHQPELEPLLYFQLTPDMVLFLFLPALIFESAIKLDARLLMKNIAPVLVLAVPALLISAGIIGIGLWVLQGFNIFHALLFGALISATDPVAVVALFKELGAPQRLAILIEGESLLNDATAIVVFNILLGLTMSADFGISDAGLAILEFLRVFFGGLLVGGTIGILLSELLYLIRAGISFYLIMSIVLAYSSFVIAEHIMHVSGVMAVIAAAITLGILGVSRIPQDARESVDATWEMIALICNSLLFLLVGLSVDMSSIILHLDSIGIAIILVLFARAAGVYSMVPATTRLFSLPHISIGEQHIMWWGGLKGGLAIAIVLSIPVDMPARDSLIYITLGVVLFSLLVNASTIRPLMHKLGFNQFSNDEMAELKHGLGQAQQYTDRILNSFYAVKLISRSTRHLMRKKTRQVFYSDDQTYDENLEARHAQITALRMEMQELKYLHDIGFLQYYTFLSIKNSLHHNRDIIVSMDIDIGDEENGNNIFLRIETALFNKLRENDWAVGILARYQYMRFSQSLQRDIAGILICAKVIEKFEVMDDFTPELRHTVIEKYNHRSSLCRRRLQRIVEWFPDFYIRFETSLFAKVALVAAEFFVEDSHRNGEIGTKVFANIERRIHGALDELRPISDPVPKLSPHDLLDIVPLLAGLPTNLLQRLAQMARSMTFLAGDLIISENEKGNALYIITHGLVAIYKEGYENEPLAHLRDGDFFGEMALLETQIRTANAKALQPTTLLRLNHKDVLSLARQEPELRARLEQASEGRRITAQSKQDPG